MFRKAHLFIFCVALFMAFLIIARAATASPAPVPTANPPSPAPTDLPTAASVTPIQPTSVITPPQLTDRQPSATWRKDRRPVIALTFDQPMNAASVWAALTITPSVTMNQRWEGLTLYLEPQAPLQPNGVYDFTLAPTATDTEGHPLAQRYSWYYHLPALIGNWSVPCRNDPPNVPISIRFDYAMDAASVVKAVTIEPPISSTVSWITSTNMVQISPTIPYTPDTTYTLRFTAPITDANGDGLLSPAPYTFTTSAAILSVQPQPHSTRSQNPGTAIKITFDRAMDKPATEAAFQITPAVAGQFGWDAATLVFTPTRGYLDESTAYTVTLRATARSAAGALILKSDYAWSFQTGAMPSITSFGMGPNIQAVNADGRRVVHFVSFNNLPASVEFKLYRLDQAQFIKRYMVSYDSTSFEHYQWRGEDQDQTVPISLAGAELAKSWTMVVAPNDHPAGYYGDIEEAQYAQEAVIPADVPSGLYILTSDNDSAKMFLALTRRTIVVKQAEEQLLAWVTDAAGAPVAETDVRVYASTGQLLAQGRTDAAGIYRAAIGSKPQSFVALAGDGENIGLTGLDANWTTYTDARASRPYAVYLYTDRPIYQPGQTVYFKAILRRDDDALLSAPAANTVVTVRLRDARNNVVRTIYLQTNALGTVNSLFRIAEGAMLGNYAIELTVDNLNYQQTFKVQAYRKPDYAVTVTTDAAVYALNNQIQVRGTARYFFDQPVANAKVTIKQYQVSGYCWTGCDDGYAWYASGQPDNVVPTDATGHFTATLKVNADYFSRYGYNEDTDFRHEQWGIEATVEDASRQSVSSFAIVDVYASPMQLELRPAGYYQTAGQPFTVTARVLALDGQPMRDRLLRLEVQQWDDAIDQYRVLQLMSLTTDAAGAADATITLAKSGYYHLHLTGRDLLGNEHFSTASVYVSDVKVVTTSAAPAPRLNLGVAQKTYAPGATASLEITSTFSGPALLTVERNTVRRTQSVNLTAPLTRVDLPILPEDAPNIFVTVNAWQAQDPTLPAPSSSRNYYDYPPNSVANYTLLSSQVELAVTPGKQLNITLSPDKTTYAPRDPVTFTVHVADQTGAPVVAEISLALVDESIFSLSNDLSGSIYNTFYFPRQDSVRTYHSLRPSRRLYLGCLGCECGCGGGGGGDEDPIALAKNPRNNFQDTAVWEPTILTNENGDAVITLVLPDNLTTWRLTARAVAADTQVGEAVARITTQQTIVIRPVAPRTLTTGDQVELAAIVYNYSAEPRQIAVRLDAQRLTVTTPVSQTIDLKPGEQHTVSWTAAATEAGEAQVTMYADAGQIGDAVQLAIPVQPLAVPDMTTLVGDFTDTFTTTVMLPADVLSLSTVKIELSRSIAGNLLSGLEYLTGYPYGCVEQTMSKAFPNAVIGRAFQQAGIGNPAVTADLPQKLEASVQRLYGYQHNDGGWGWWYDDDTDAYQTALVVFGLSVTAEAGHEVDAGVIRRGADWLTENLSQMDAPTRAFALYSLAEAGHGDLAATRRLVTDTDKLDTFSRAALALALHKLGATADAEKMLALLAQSAVVENGLVYWPNANYDGTYHQKTMASTTRSTALALEAFVRIDPDHALEPGIVRYLMSRRRGDGWGTTNETSFTILALTDHLLAKELTPGKTGYSVELNGRMIASGALGKGNPLATLEIPASQMSTGANILRLTQSGDGHLYYLVNSRIYRPQTAIEAAGRVNVSRVYREAETGHVITGAVVPGQLVKVELTVNLPGDGYYMLVEDKLPGGLEALNEGLNTTSHDASVQTCYDNYECDWEPSFYWQDYGYNNKEIHNDRVSFFITQLAPGRHTFTYYARATQSGQFAAMPAEAYAMYDLTLWGRSTSSVVRVEQ